MTDPANNVKKRDLVVTRLFDAPLELVWKAWTEPEHVMRWWGPNYFTSPTCEIDFRAVVTFKAVGDKTEMTMTEYGLPDTQMFELAELGLHQTLDKMAASFPRA